MDVEAMLSTTTAVGAPRLNLIFIMATQNCTSTTDQSSVAMPADRRALRQAGFKVLRCSRFALET